MTGSSNISVNVTISDALRRLWAERHMAGSTHEDPVDPGPVETHQAATARPVSVRVKLRKDGHRPMSFDGLLLWHAKTDVPKEHPVLSHRIAVYLMDTGDLCAAASLEPPDQLPLRPHFQCSEISGLSQWQDWLGGWHSTAVLPTLDLANIDPLEADGLLPEALHPLFGSPLSKTERSMERNDSCRQ